MKCVAWFCYASVRPDGTLKAASWILAAAERLAQCGLRLCLIAPGPDAPHALERITTETCELYRLPACLRNERQVSQELIGHIGRLLEELDPDVFQIFGTEFSSYLCAGLAAQQLGMKDRTVVWMQGVCKKIAEVYCDGLSFWEAHRLTFRDLLRLDNIYCQKRKFEKRAENERRLLNAVGHAVGRTEFDRMYVKQAAPQVQYHSCPEILRSPFYSNQWELQKSEPCRLFMSQGDYPIKGLHILLQALPKVLQKHPDVVLYISGENVLERTGLRSWLTRHSYEICLRKRIKRYKLEKNVVFTGYLTAEEMVAQYQKARVFVMPSLVENSPNSLGEAMLMGAPCVAAAVGGIPSMINGGQEGLLYEKTDADALTTAILQVLEDATLAVALGENARARALQTHDQSLITKNLMEIYRNIGGQEDESQ